VTDRLIRATAFVVRTVAVYSADHLLIFLRASSAAVAASLEWG
jgi:hypothetical protein